MATWEDLDNESGSDKDEVEDEANVVVGLVARVASKAESGTNFEDENEICLGEKKSRGHGTWTVVSHDT